MRVAKLREVVTLNEAELEKKGFHVALQNFGLTTLLLCCHENVLVWCSYMPIQVQIDQFYGLVILLGEGMPATIVAELQCQATKRGSKNQE